MAKYIKTLLFSCILISTIVSISNAQTCPNYRFSRNVIFTRCNDLPVLNSFLHWNYHPSNGSVDIAYRQPGVVDSNRWVAWALNVNGRGMLGAQALVALVNSSGIIHAYTSPIPTNSYNTMLAEGALSFNVPKIEAEFVNNEMIIFATLELPGNQTSFNQAWQEGPASGGSPGRHTTIGSNVRSSGNVNFLSEQNINTDTGSGGGIIIPRLKRKNVHGVLNAISWGTLMPLGAIIARYLKVFNSADPAWFYLHITCQSSAYIIGIAGWVTGLMLGSDSVGLSYNIHRNIGITLFCLGTLQVFALLLRPNKDHKYRLYWNIYHHSTGYTVIILSIVNIFRGFDMLVPDKKWKNAYTGILICFGVIAAMLEAYTWYIVIKRKRSASRNHPQGTSETNGVNGYGNKSQQEV